MSDGEDLDLGIEQEERLPWLEPIDDDSESDVSMSSLWGLVLAGLVVIGLVVGGLWWWQNAGGRPRGELIAAPDGDYKVAPRPEPRRFDGDGTVAIAASEGESPTGRIDPAALPERPMPPPAARPPAAARPASADRPPTPPAARTSTATRPSGPIPASVPVSSAAGSSGTVQLGAFTSEATAARAWDGLKARFEWLAPVNRSIVAAEVNGRTVYRLRAAAGTASAARDLCARLRVAGENCIVLP